MIQLKTASSKPPSFVAATISGMSAGVAGRTVMASVMADLQGSVAYTVRTSTSPVMPGSSDHPEITREWRGRAVTCRLTAMVTTERENQWTAAPGPGRG
ncbi:hypothetical protein GCM10027290_26100 [Micromonospora sonneratiae]